MNSKLYLLIAVIVGLVAFSSCSDDDPLPHLTGAEDTFAIFALGNSGISGSAYFSERSDGATVVKLIVKGTSSGNTHPAHIHIGNGTTNGDIAISLTPVDGATGESETVITETNAGTAITYQELIDFDGYINIHKSEAELDQIVAYGDIGPNELTGDAEFYVLKPTDEQNDTDSAIVSFKERVNGETLVEVKFIGSTAVAHPMHIHHNTAAMGGGIAISLKPVEGAWTRSNISQLDDGTAISFDELINFDGYINIHESAANLSNVIMQGDIGRNEFTGNREIYDLHEQNSSGIAGKATFLERQDGTTLVWVSLAGTATGSSHPNHIHENSATAGGGIAITLNPVANGTGKTEVDALDNGTAITYDELLNYNGHINVHLASDALNVVVARGDIGSNAN